MSENDNKIKSYPKEHYKRLENAYYSTQGFKKIWNYFLEIVKSNDFQNEVKNLRKRYKIPKDGLKQPVVADDMKNFTGYQLKKFTNGSRIIQIIQTIMYGYFLPPDEWIFYRAELIPKFNLEIKELCKKYCLHFVDWTDIMKLYVFYNKIEKPFYPNASNLCLLADRTEEKEEPYSKEIQEMDDIVYPIVLRISPYASERDILDYIKKVYKISIEPLQESYKNKYIKIGKVKSKKQSTQERNQFIWENRNLPRRKIKELVENKFNEVLDYEYVGKIISDEKKRRKEL